MPVSLVGIIASTIDDFLWHFDMVHSYLVETNQVDDNYVVFLGVESCESRIKDARKLLNNRIYCVIHPTDVLAACSMVLRIEKSRVLLIKNGDIKIAC